MSQEAVFYSRIWPEFEFSDNPYFMAREWEAVARRLTDLVAGMVLLSDGVMSRKALLLQGELLFLVGVANSRSIYG